MGDIEVSTGELIARITINKPNKGNSLTYADIQQFISHIDAVEQSDARVLIISGAGEKTFCAGAALDQLSSGNMDGDIFSRLTDRLASVRQATICALNGSVYGGGTELAICCDFRLGVLGMRQFIPAARFSLCYPPGGIARLVECLGLHNAKRMLMACEQFDAEDLLAIGFLTQLCSREQFKPVVDDLANRIAVLGPLAVQSMKKISNHISQSSVDSEQIAAWVATCNESADLREGLLAASEKRDAVFTGY